MKAMGVTEFAEKMGVSTTRARKLCRDGRIVGAYRSGGAWIIPGDARVTPGRFGPELRIAKGRTDPQ